MRIVRRNIPQIFEFGATPKPLSLKDQKETEGLFVLLRGVFSFEKETRVAQGDARSDPEGVHKMQRKIYSHVEFNEAYKADA